MTDPIMQYKVAAIHAAPVFMDRDASVEKACDLIDQSGKGGALLAVFPEGYIPGFPLWAMINPPYEIHELYLRQYDNSIFTDGPEIQRLRVAAKKAGIYVSLGVNEKRRESPGTIWAANVIIDPDGRVISRHRKLVPTYAEKLVWSNGDGTGLKVVETKLGALGALICGENTNTLARFALLAQGEQVHLSSYPPAWPFKKPGDTQEFDPLRANEIRAAAHAFEGKVFNVVACGFCDERTMELSSLSDEAREVLEKTPKPGSMIVGPAGNIIAGPLTGDKEEILLADIDLSAGVIEKQAHDITGGYNRFDIFSLNLRRRPLQSLYIDEPDPVSDRSTLDVSLRGAATADAEQDVPEE